MFLSPEVSLEFLYFLSKIKSSTESNDEEWTVASFKGEENVWNRAVERVGIMNLKLGEKYKEGSRGGKTENLPGGSMDYGGKGEELSVWILFGSKLETSVALEE